MFTGILRRVRSVQKLVQYSSQPKRQKRRWRWKILGTVGVFCGGYYGWKYIKEYTKPTFEGPKKRLVILGSGWGAMSVLKHLEPGQFEVVIVSPRNYFMFTPLLPSVTVGTVEARSIVEPVRKILAKQYAKHPVNFLEAECMSVNPEKKTIHCKDRSGVVGAVESFDLDYDLLVMAVGATTNTFRTPGVEEHAHFLKEIPDARRIRDILIDNVETASIPGQPVEERKRLLHIVVVGGGPTGVEFAAEAADFLREDVSRIYPNVIEDCKVTLIHSRRSVLNTYDKTISDYTQSTMKSDKVNLVTNSRVTKVTEKAVEVLDKKTGKTTVYPTGLVVWSTGIAPVPLTKSICESLPEQCNKNALLTDPYLRVLGAEGIFAIGDCSTISPDFIHKRAKELFDKADTNGNGSLDEEEFYQFVEQVKIKYPQLMTYLSMACDYSIENLFHKADQSGDNALSFDEFEQSLKEMDKNLTHLPPTAQVANQQGQYLGHLLTTTNGDITTKSEKELQKAAIKPFEYHHLGSFAYVGDNKAVLKMPIIGSVSGAWTMWLWRAAYASELASWRTKFLVVGDWAKSYVFGRDSSRI